MSRQLPALALVATAALVAGCGGSSEPTSSEPTSSAAAEKPSVAVSFFPLADAAQKIGGDAVSVVNLTPPGTGPHDLEVTPRQRGEIEDAQGLFYLGNGFQPQVEQVAAGLGDGVEKLDMLTVADLLPVTAPLSGVQGEVDGEELTGGKDPHVWVSPRDFRKWVTSMGQTLEKVAPASKDAIAAATTAYVADLDTLDQEFTARLKNCQSTAIVTSHRAFEYLARDYGLTQIPIAGISPEEEPDPRTLEAVAAAAKERNVTTVYFEDALPPGLSETVAQEIGATTDLLSPLETIPQEELDAGATYVSVQRDNLDRLVKGLRCSG